MEKFIPDYDWLKEQYGEGTYEQLLKKYNDQIEFDERLADFFRNGRRDIDDDQGSLIETQQRQEWEELHGIVHKPSVKIELEPYDGDDTLPFD